MMNMKNLIKKRGDASMVAMVLLVMAAIVAGAMVASFSQKSTKKVSEKIVEIGTSIECNDIKISLKLSEGNLIAKNRGTLGVDKIVVRKYGDDVTTEDFDTFDNNEKLLPNAEFNIGSVGGSDKIEAKPIFINEEGDLIGCSAVTYDLQT